MDIITIDEWRIVCADRDRLSKDNEVLREALDVSIKALDYCSVDPGYLHPHNNRPNAVAMNARAEMNTILQALNQTQGEGLE